jgi:hypothetical protein
VGCGVGHCGGGVGELECVWVVAMVAEGSGYMLHGEGQIGTTVQV